MGSSTTRSGRMLIGGQLCDSASGRWIESINPATEKLVGRAPDGSAADVDRAVSEATVAASAWAEVPYADRARSLIELAERIDQRRDEIVELEIADSGLTRAKVEADVAMAMRTLRYYAGLGTEIKGETIPGTGGDLHLSIRQPYGVVARIVPFNHPFQFVTSKLAAPVMAGNAVILKPAEQTPLTATILAELCAEVFPPGVVSIITGGAEVGSALVRHPAIRRIAFIGSTATGLAIQRDAASVNVKNITLELGGKNPFIMFPDVDIDRAVSAAITGMNFGHQGQSCGSTSRLFLHESIYEEALGELVRRVSQIRVGDPADPAVGMGPMNSREQLEKTRSYIALGLEQGASLKTGGLSPVGPEFDAGFWIRPTVFGDVLPHMRIFREEIFGPVLSVIRWREVDEVVEMANSVDLGLTAAIWTNDLRLAVDTARKVEAGFCWINGVSRHYPGVPFGGVKDSGLGSEEGLSELLSYTQSKIVNVVHDG
jgi:betaine-aldehyde dehydrogenase